MRLPDLLTATAYGRNVGLRLHGLHVSDVRAWLPFWWVDADVDAERVWDLESLETAEGMIRALELWVAEHAIGLTFVHAGVVAVGERALLLPGRSLAGKSTLTAELLRAGADYGSDEYAVLDNDGLVHAYPRPLSLRTADGRPRTPASAFGATTFARPLPVEAVAVLRYAPRAEFAVAPLTPGRTVLHLFDNTISARTRPEAAFDCLVRTTAQPFRAVLGVRGEAQDAANAVIDLLRH